MYMSVVCNAYTKEYTCCTLVNVILDCHLTLVLVRDVALVQFCDFVVAGVELFYL